MLAKLFLAFTIIPLIELLLLIPLGQQIGVWPTIAIVVFTGALGAVLGKRQGMDAWRRFKGDLATGQLPGESLLDGLLILIACTLLITPGVLTDVVGITLLFAPARRPLRGLLKHRFIKMLQNPSLTVIDGALEPRPRASAEEPEVIDITP